MDFAMKSWYVTLLLIGLVASFIAGYHIRSTCVKNVQIERDTVIDTLRTVLPVAFFEIEVGEVEIPYPIVIKEKGQDKIDTIYVPVPITQKEYLTDDYHAWVSGYNPSLDSIDVFQETMYITKRQSSRRWGIGITAGYGIGRNGLSPYVGIGGYYRIW